MVGILLSDERSKGVKGLTVDYLCSSYSRICQFHREQISDSEEVVTSLVMRMIFIHQGILLP